MPSLGLDATQRGKYDYYSKSCGRSYLPFNKGFPVYLIFQSVSMSVTNRRGTDIPCLPIAWLWIENLLHCQYADDIQSDDKCGKHRNREYGAKEVFFYCFLVGSTENL